VAWWIVSAAYLLLNNFRFKGPYGLMFHCTSHRPWFKGNWNFFYHYQNWFIGLLFGQTPNTYKSHHLGMHHRENNLTPDDSSTMAYQRDSIWDFHKYVFAFFLTAIINLVNYFNYKKQKTLRNRVLVGEISYWIIVIGLSFINFPATLVVLILPLIIARYIMMLGNWTQHAFVDPKHPGNSYVNSISCINNGYNKKCWNDGYHISHHLRPNLHWTEHPNHLMKHQDEYAQNKSIVFDGIHYLHIWFFLMTKNYDKLADHLVNIKGMFKSRDEAIDLMKVRTQKIPVNS
jgi:fatty acid desaturase